MYKKQDSETVHCQWRFFICPKIIKNITVFIFLPDKSVKARKRVAENWRSIRSGLKATE